MIDFLTKSTLSLFVLLAVYHLVLEKEKMNIFNRFYLLFSIVFSFAIPFITIEVITKTIAPIQQTYTYVAQENIKVPEIKETIDYTPIVLWSLYALVTSILLFRYFRNILKIVSNIKSNQITEYKNAKLVLLEEQTPPHTFLNYIFLNKADYQNRKINKQLYAHELIHVNQRHTFDVLFVEAVKTVFWFNPIFIFYKKAIQLNHEFLADEKVVSAYKDIPLYQSLLLAHVNTSQTFALTSNLNYSITKKRFVMMTKTISKTRNLLYKIALLPIFSGLIFVICIESVAQVKTTTVSNDKNKQIAKNTYEFNSGLAVSTIKNENSPAKIPNKFSSKKTVSIIKKDNLDNLPVGEPEFVVNFQYDLKGTEINETDLQNSLDKLGNYLVSTYKSPEGIDKREEILVVRFVIKRNGKLEDVKALPEKGTEPETKLISILKSSPKTIFENIYGKADGDKILIQVMFKPKGIEEILAKQHGIPVGKIAVGFPILK